MVAIHLRDAIKKTSFDVATQHLLAPECSSCRIRVVSGLNEQCKTNLIGSSFASSLFAYPLTGCVSR